MTKIKPTKQSDKKTGRNKAERRYRAVRFQQGKHTLYAFCAPATELWSFLSINRRDTNKDEGYQRVLPNSRLRAVAAYVRGGNAIPNSLLVSFEENTKFDEQTSEIIIPSGTDVGWVIDGQHRLAGAHLANEENETLYEFCVIAAIGLDIEKQIELFITINREAKGVPTSLVLDLLGKLPQKRPGDVANERAADLAKALRDDPDSPLYRRIVIDSPRSRQVSLTNFVRKVTPVVHTERGRIAEYSFEQQRSILNNYFLGIKNTFSEEWKRDSSIFFKTIGFGALMNIFVKVFDQAVSRYSSFTSEDVQRMFSLIDDFDFNQWSTHGSGTKAESDAADDLWIDLSRAIKEEEEKGTLRKLKL